MKYKKGDTQHGSQRNEKKQRIFKANHGNRAFNEFCKYECECKFDDVDDDGCGASLLWVRSLCVIDVFLCHCQARKPFSIILVVGCFKKLSSTLEIEKF